MLEWCISLLKRRKQKKRFFHLKYSEVNRLFYPVLAPWIFTNNGPLIYNFIIKHNSGKYLIIKKLNYIEKDFYNYCPTKNFFSTSNKKRMKPLFAGYKSKGIEVYVKNNNYTRYRRLPVKNRPHEFWTKIVLTSYSSGLRVNRRYGLVEDKRYKTRKSFTNKCSFCEKNIEGIITACCADSSFHFLLFSINFKCNNCNQETNFLKTYIPQAVECAKDKDFNMQIDESDFSIIESTYKKLIPLTKNLFMGLNEKKELVVITINDKKNKNSIKYTPNEQKQKTPSDLIIIDFAVNTEDHKEFAFVARNRNKIGVYHCILGQKVIENNEKKDKVLFKKIILIDKEPNHIELYTGNIKLTFLEKEKSFDKFKIFYENHPVFLENRQHINNSDLKNIFSKLQQKWPIGNVEFNNDPQTIVELEKTIALLYIASEFIEHIMINVIKISLLPRLIELKNRYQETKKKEAKMKFDTCITQLKDEFKKKDTIDKNTNPGPSLFQKLINLFKNVFLKKIDMTNLEKADLIIGLF